MREIQKPEPTWCTFIRTIAVDSWLRSMLSSQRTFPLINAEPQAFANAKLEVQEIF